MHALLLFSKQAFSSILLPAVLQLNYAKEVLQLQVLNVIYGDSTAEVSGASKPAFVPYLPPQIKARAQLRNQTCKMFFSNAPLKFAVAVNAESEQATRERNQDAIRQRQRDMINEHFHRPDDGLRYGRGCQEPFGYQEPGTWADQKYYEYYEYLCKVSRRSLKN
ncbi:unnamed protein product [Gongylonema pulchrum]|uniref:Uncharacterized protein n=1 Tax=Gongylonema pulchrum TaxID=637853 RepID=A0A183DK96_9BILA|nr:unnamed protein product [Gongylonema pulchrum]